MKKAVLLLLVGVLFAPVLSLIGMCIATVGVASTTPLLKPLCS